MGQKRNPFLKKIKFYMATMVGGFKYFLFSSLFGEMIQFDGPHIFQMGWFNHQPDDSGDFFNHFFPPKNCGPGESIGIVRKTRPQRLLFRRWYLGLWDRDRSTTGKRPQDNFLGSGILT